MGHCVLNYVVDLEGKDGDNQTSKSVPSVHRIDSNRHSVNGISVAPVSCIVTDSYTEQSEGTIRLKSSTATKNGKIFSNKTD